MFDVDERCIAVGVKVMAATALTAIGSKHETESMISDERLGAVRAVRGARPSAGGVTLAGPLLAGYSSAARRCSAAGAAGHLEAGIW
jgi:hypothetical protein